MSQWKQVSDHQHVKGEIGCLCGADVDFSEGQQVVLCLKCRRRYLIDIKVDEMNVIRSVVVPHGDTFTIERRAL